MGCRDMTPADRARIAAAYGIDPATIPEPQTIARGVSNDPLLLPQERINLACAAKRRGRKIQAADRRAGIITQVKCRTWGEE